jgi:putative ABC transport system substrate-binding protein
MRRREFLKALTGAAALWPPAARAQQTAMPVIGFLGSPSAAEFRHLVTAFSEGLNELGYVEGRNAAIEYRWAEGHYDLLPRLADDLVRRNVALIFAAGSSAPALAAKAATTTIPIVFAHGADPVKLGLVASLNRPGANITGISFLSADLGAKRLGLMQELVPTATVGAVLINPNNPNAESVAKDAQESARALGLQCHVWIASTDQDLNTAFAGLVRQPVGALLVSADPFFLDRRVQLAALAARHAVPAIYFAREFVAAGGLMSYGTSIAAAYRQAGVQAGKILKGAKPADLPVEQSTKFEFVINLTIARALGLDVPPTLLARADEVIE